MQSDKQVDVDELVKSMIKMSLKTKISVPQGMNIIKENEEEINENDDQSYHQQLDAQPYGEGDFDMNQPNMDTGSFGRVKSEQGGYEPNWNATFNIDAFVQDEEEEFHMKEG